jgi:predicted AAA+ superfamily ATPase
MPELVEGIVAEHLIREFGKIFYYYLERVNSSVSKKGQ